MNARLTLRRAATHPLLAITAQRDQCILNLHFQPCEQLQWAIPMASPSSSPMKVSFPSFPTYSSELAGAPARTLKAPGLHNADVHLSRQSTSTISDSCEWWGKVHLEKSASSSERTPASPSPSNTFAKMKVSICHRGPISDLQSRLTSSLVVRSESVRNIIRERRMLEHLNHAFLCNLRYSFQDIEYL